MGSRQRSAIKFSHRFDGMPWAMPCTVLRLNLSSPRPSPFADAVLERVKKESLFVRAWNRRIVAGEPADETAFVRNHAVVGRLVLYAVDFGTSMGPDLIFRTVVPADNETVEKFKVLESIAEAPMNSADRGKARHRCVEGMLA
jgi:hypothetical protein